MRSVRLAEKRPEVRRQRKIRAVFLTSCYNPFFSILPIYEHVLHLSGLALNVLYNPYLLNVYLYFQ